MFCSTLMDESQSQLFVGGSKVFGLHSRFTDGSHEIGVARPARQHVQVQMSENPRTGRPAQIHAKVVSLRMVSGFESLLNALSKQHHFGESFGRDRAKFGHMREGND